MSDPMIPRDTDTGDTPIPKRGKPPEGWRRAFLSALRRTCNVRAAAVAANVARKTAYRHRHGDPKFAEAWDDAIESATDTLEAEARRRAMEGTERPVFHRGRECGTVREYSDTLLIFLLKAYRPERFRDNFSLKRFLEEAEAHRSLLGQAPAGPAPGEGPR